MNWKTPASIIDNILIKSNKLIRDKVEKAWKSIPGIENKADIVTLSNGELIIKVKNNAYLQELSFRREEIKQKMNNKLNGHVKKIKLRLGG